MMDTPPDSLSLSLPLSLSPPLSLSLSLSLKEVHEGYNQPVSRRGSLKVMVEKRWTLRGDASLCGDKILRHKRHYE